MNFRILLVVALTMPASSSLAQFTELYSTDFTEADGFANGGIAGQSGWEGQPDWSVTDAAGAGFLSATGNWQRSRTFNGLIEPVFMNEGTQVGITATMDITGTLAGTGDFFRIGLGAAPEHTGAQTPQVHANFAYDGAGNITAGDASVLYAPGDVLELEMIITRGTSELDWGLETTLTNVTQTATSGPVSSTPTDLTGTIGFPAGGIPGGTPSTLHQYIEAGTNSLLAFRMLNNTDGVTVNLDSLAISIDPVIDAVPGDANGDGDVDGDDFLQLQRDGADLTDWLNSYPTPLSGISAFAVPEPSSLVLLLAGLMMANRRGSPVRSHC